MRLLVLRAPSPARDPSNCPGPHTVFDPWNVIAFVPGADGEPVPIEYTLNTKAKAHRINILDIDSRDTRMKFYIDGVSQGVTRDVEVDKEMDCGEDVASCLERGFSAGVIVVPPGKHTVKIEWFGKG